MKVISDKPSPRSTIVDEFYETMTTARRTFAEAIARAESAQSQAAIEVILSTALVTVRESIRGVLIKYEAKAT